jgi:hypothetical protein
MTTINITAGKGALVPGAPATGIVSTQAVVTDNSGGALPKVILTGIETPPWSATLTGTAGALEASVTFTDLDINGATVGTPVVVTESGSGGVIGNLPGTVAAGSSITVT